MLTTYHTIAKSGVSEIVIKGSHFICSLQRVLQTRPKHSSKPIKKSIGKATHNCSAYLIGDQNEIQRAPMTTASHPRTAGVPMLEYSRKWLRVVAAVVTVVRRIRLVERIDRCLQPIGIDGLEGHRYRCPQPRTKVGCIVSYSHPEIRELLGAIVHAD